jgi:hypothetical protein
MRIVEGSQKPPPTAYSHSARVILAEFSLWTLFFLISAGLGYATLSRYDPRKQLPDAAIYAQMAARGPASVEGHLGFRVLVPLLARAVFAVFKGHTGNWDPLMFSFLVVNTFFVASTAYLITKIGALQLGNRSVALLGATFYLLNFAIANLQLAALVDSAEAFSLMVMVVSMFYGRWALLPLCGILGTLAKESFAPFSIAMAVGWWLTPQDRSSRSKALWIVSMTAAEVVALFSLQSAISGHPAWPWVFLGSMNSQTGYAMNFVRSLVDRNSWYILIWLLPLGLAGIKRMPAPWRSATGLGTLTAMALNAYHSTVGGGGGGIGRYIFDIAGPFLSLSAAAFLASWQGSEHPQGA